MITFKELEEQLDEAHKVGDKVLIHKGPADVKGKEGHVSEIRKGLYKGAPKTYTIDYDHHETTGARKSIQLKPTHFKAIKEGLKPDHNMRPGWMLKADPELAAKVKKNKDIAKARKASYGNPAAGKSVKEESELDEARMTAAMKLQQAFQREQEKTARERKAGEDLLKKDEPKKTNEEVEQIDEAPKDHTIEAHGIKGTKGTPWRKTFKHEDHLNDWAEKNDSVEVHGVRELEGAKKHVKEAVVQFPKKKTDAPREIEKHDVENAWALKHVAAKDDKISYQHNGVTLHHKNGDSTFILGGHKPLFDRDGKDKPKFKDDLSAARRAFKMPTKKASSDNVVNLKKEEVACNNVGDGKIAGTQGDAGKKSVVTKMLKRKVVDFKEFVEIEEGKPGLWANIHAKRKRIKNGSGEKMRAPGSKGAPTAQDFKNSQEQVEAQFDMIEELVEELAIVEGVDSEVVWDRFDSFSDEELLEYAIDKKGHKSSTGGLTQKGVDAYNRKTGGNLKTAVTTPPSKLKPGSKAANRRKSFCARMSGVDGPMKKPNGEPTRKALALRKWNC